MPSLMMSKPVPWALQLYSGSSFGLCAPCSGFYGADCNFSLKWFYVDCLGQCLPNE